MNSTILPVEIKVRDFPQRLLMACFAARQQNSTVILGKEANLLSVASQLPRGNWLFKSITIEDLASLIEINELGFSCFVDDAESGGISSDTLIPMRIESTAIPLVKRFFTWGEFHRNLFSSVWPEHADRFVASGTPRFDLLRKPFCDRYTRANYPFLPDQPYVLLNSSFGIAGKLTCMSEQTAYDVLRIYCPNEQILNIRWGAYRHWKKLFEYFIGLLNGLDEANLSQKIVLRPHPNESVEKWQGFLSADSKIKIIKEGSVEPWLLNSDFLIHAGCTTSIEAFVAGIASIRYAPIADSEDFKKLVGFLLGANESFSNLEQLIKTVSQHLQGYHYNYSQQIRSDNQYRLAAINHRYASENIVDCLASENHTAPSTSDLKQAKLKLEQHTKKRSEINVSWGADHEKNKYSGITLAEIEEQLDLLYSVYPDFSNIKVHQLGDEVFTIEKRPMKDTPVVKKQEITVKAVSTQSNMPISNNDNKYSRTTPVSRKFGLDLGTSICRYYIHSFLDKYKAQIQGDILEIGDDRYTQQFGQNIISSRVLTADPNRINAIQGDLGTGKNLPVGEINCFICTQTIQCVFDIKATVKNAVKTLKPGGVLLLTASGISQISKFDYERWGEYWRLTKQSMELLLKEVAPKAEIIVESYGNLAASKAYLDGVPAESMDAETLAVNDDDYQMLITGILKMPPAQNIDQDQVLSDDIQTFPIEANEIDALRTLTDNTLTYQFQFNNLLFRTNLPASLATELDLIFQRKIYHFDAIREDPLVIDCGAHIGAFSLYILNKYPKAKIIAFEPEEKSWQYLNANLQLNFGTVLNTQVTTVKKGLSHFDGEFSLDMRDADGSTTFSEKTTTMEVSRLGKYLDRPVDFLKLNIVGAELDVLRDIEPQLHRVREICLIYHGFDEVGQRLHEILDILHRNGFRYLVNDLGKEINPACQPPFCIDTNSRFSLLVYARRLQETPPTL
jgi:surface carbohydrate biosynthesis protein/FkbM family methyltransferase